MNRFHIVERKIFKIAARLLRCTVIISVFEPFSAVQHISVKNLCYTLAELEQFDMIKNFPTAALCRIVKINIIVNSPKAVYRTIGIVRNQIRKQRVDSPHHVFHFKTLLRVALFVITEVGQHLPHESPWKGILNLHADPEFISNTGIKPVTHAVALDNNLFTVKRIVERMLLDNITYQRGQIFKIV